MGNQRQISFARAIRTLIIPPSLWNGQELSSRYEHLAEASAELKQDLQDALKQVMKRLVPFFS